MPHVFPFADKKVEDAGPANGLADLIRFTFMVNGLTTCSKIPPFRHASRGLRAEVPWRGLLAMMIDHVCFHEVGWPYWAMCDGCRHGRPWYDTDSYCICGPGGKVF